MQLVNFYPTWKNLEQHYQKISKEKISNLFLKNPDRSQQFSLKAADLFLDFSKNLIDSTTLNLLEKVAEEAKLKDYIEKMFTGTPINRTENIPVLHTALRDQEKKTDIIIDAEEIHPLIAKSLKKMEHFANDIRKGKWKGYSNKPITDLVNIGIGGSDLGPAMVTKALKPYTDDALHYHFISNVDGTHISETLKKLNPETTLFIISSKKFLTPETLCNSNSAREWLLSQTNNKTNTDIVKHHFVAVTAKVERAVAFGIDENNVYPFWDWVGGRFSLWSSIGLIIATAIGMDHFKDLLKGAYAMDYHFRFSPLSQNMPVILALIGIWYINFFKAKTEAIIPYDQYLELLPNYLQQLEMESNGKSIDWDGNSIDYDTAPIIWGAVGTNGQHAFHQLLLQGTQMVPIDFILSLKTHNPIGNHQELLVANCFAQAQALMQGKSLEEIEQELLNEGINKEKIEKLAPHKIVRGNRPTNMILLPELTPKTLGALLALYEHKVFVQGIIWRINSFDQWGVELGKKMANKIIPALQRSKDRSSIEDLDSSTKNLIDLYLNAKQN